MQIHRDTDESEFRPAKAARDGLTFSVGDIPDGFYLVGDDAFPQPEWHKTIIESVKKVTHIAPGDSEENPNTILGVPKVQEGCIVLPAPSLALCCSVTGAQFTTTTEVYPDSPSKPVSEDECNRAQVASVTGALDGYLKVMGGTA